MQEYKQALTLGKECIMAFDINLQLLYIVYIVGSNVAVMAPSPCTTKRAYCTCKAIRYRL